MEKQKLYMKELAKDITLYNEQKDKYKIWFRNREYPTRYQLGYTDSRLEVKSIILNK